VCVVQIQIASLEELAKSDLAQEQASKAKLDSARKEQNAHNKRVKADERALKELSKQVGRSSVRLSSSPPAMAWPLGWLSEFLPFKLHTVIASIPAHTVREVCKRQGALLEAIVSPCCVHHLSRCRALSLVAPG
jgi:hypothetical protein